MRSCLKGFNAEPEGLEKCHLDFGAQQQNEAYTSPLSSVASRSSPDATLTTCKVQKRKETCVLVIQSTRVAQSEQRRDSGDFSIFPREGLAINIR
ncbi:unnamed protein product [Protopolystoma xenopodis]|uniref:Uncharacterized protein n=1 Tax=Protopolystoma xenopodis TaxID=117903 RepID=A0A3S5BP73_9PLAT|nr:unnamed protein product [Protopolystoma xenopodis]